MSSHFKGQKTATKINIRINKFNVSGKPTLRKSPNLYLPGPNAKMVQMEQSRT